MTILLPLSVHSMVGDPFTDYLNVTFPLDVLDLVRRDLRPLIDSMGCAEIVPGLFSTEDRGTLKFSTRGKVGIVSASGVFLDCLRRVPGRYTDYLAALSGYPWRISMIHATQDYMVPSPPDVIQAIKALAQAGGVSLTRKAIQPSQVSALMGIDLRGAETGTIYLGKKGNADVWAKAYDKRHERECRAGRDPGPVVRIEIAVQSAMGATLKDAHDPSSMFFHFASRTLCEAPPGIAPWSGHGEGYVLPPSRSYTALQRIGGILEGSLDVSRLVQLAQDEWGDRGLDVLLPMLRRRFALPPGVA